MLELLWLVPAIPFAGFLTLVLAGRRLPAAAAAAVGTGSTGLSMVAAFLASAGFVISRPVGYTYSQVLWTWFRVDGLAPAIGLHLDALSLVMIIVITTVSFLIHLYSTGFMKGEEGYSRFFAYMNFFVGSMLVLVLADNLLFLYLGWEGVGLCSYLLIGFWYRDGDNGKAAMKAFVVTRIGDTLLAIGLFILFVNLDTLHVQEVMQRARQLWPQGSILATIVAAMLLGGAVGKSAQLPLQTWLPDAMAGPTPVSALIHAATMVTAGVYLIARTNVLFSLAPDVQFAVAVIGAITLLMAGASALTQRDIKRVLAYSTMSQVGYMFLALGVGAWSAAIFHFMTHAFFKALLFLGAGVVIQALDNEHDIFRMGGLRKSLPAAFWAFLVGAASLSALPLVTAGFYSKDLILLDVWSSARGSIWLWAAGMIGAVLTSLYAFRVVFVVFFGEKETTVRKRPSTPMVVSLFVFSVFSIISGFVQMPENLGNVTFFTDLTHVALPGVPLLPVSASRQTGLQIAASLVSLLGIFLSGLLYLGRPSYATRLAEHRPGSLLHRVWSSGWGFDRFYGTVFVAPFTLFARWNKDDFVDLFYGGLGRLARAGNELLVLTQSGRVRWYVMGLALGAVIFIGIVVFV